MSCKACVTESNLPHSRRDLAQALKVREWSDTDPIRKREFEGSVFFTSGIFNVMMSLLPPRVIKMAEVVGFHGDRVHLQHFNFFLKQTS